MLRSIQLGRKPGRNRRSGQTHACHGAALWVAVGLALGVFAPPAAFSENRWGNSQNAWGNSKNPWANSQNSWGRTPSPKPGKPSNYSGYVAVPSGPIADNPAMNNTIPDGLRSPPPKKRKARRTKPPSEAPAKKSDSKD